MNCLKCGREIPEDQVFCDACLEVMKKYPVKPGTPVVIHPRESRGPDPVKKKFSTEEMLSRLQKRNRCLSRWVTALSIVLVISLGLLGYAIYREFTVPALGQNYSTETSAPTLPR